MATNHPPSEELGTQIEADDWTDMDLLTKDLAGDLLRQEIESETASLSELEGDTTLSDAERAASVDLRRRRIAAMEHRRDELATDSGPPGD